MLKKIFRVFKELVLFPYSIYSFKKESRFVKVQLESTQMMSAKLLHNFNLQRENEILENIQVAEFKVFSQWGDDGIIQFLISYLEIETKTFIEFGVQDYKESNTRYLLINNNWSGLILDGSASFINEIQQEAIYWKYDLTAKCSFVTAKNINSTIEKEGFKDEIGLLHIDIDGNDYWVWKEIKVVNPIVVIMEYNSIFGCQNAWTVPYDENFVRTEKHYSNLYFGASLLSLCDLAEEKGYVFIGCNSNGNNAFFVRKDKIGNLKPLSAKEGFVLSKFRESRNQKGVLTYLRNEERLQLIKNKEVFNTRTQLTETISSVSN